MCTLFVYNGNDMITGFNFDIDLAVWKHKVIKEKERFYIGILRPDGTYPVSYTHLVLCLILAYNEVDGKGCIGISMIAVQSSFPIQKTAVE